MSTKIEYVDLSANPVVGCSHCSPGCDNCYAERRAAILAKNPNPKISGKYAGVVDKHGKWTGKLSALDLSCFSKLPKKPKSVFVGSMADVFHINNSFSNLRILFAAMMAQPQHTFMLLTKRHDRMWSFMDDHRSLAAPNVWLGVTVCNQAEANKKIPVLLQTPAAKRFVSVEPMLGVINLRKAYPQEYMYCSLCKWHGYSDDLVRKMAGIYQEEYCPVCGNDGTFALDYPYEDSELALGGMDWVICGGETGPKARPMHPDWVRSLRDQCKASRCQPTPFFFKSWGGKRRSDRLLDGCEWNEVPI